MTLAEENNSSMAGQFTHTSCRNWAAFHAKQLWYSSGTIMHNSGLRRGKLQEHGNIPVVTEEGGTSLF